MIETEWRALWDQRQCQSNGLDWKPPLTEISTYFAICLKKNEKNADTFTAYTN